MSRGAIEQMLHELTGFSRDSADITRALNILDSYAADMAFALGGAPTPVIESYLHLLHQQAELLLDSGRSLRQVEEAGLRLAERVEELAARISVHDHPYYDRPVAEDRFALTDDERAAVRATLDAEVREIESQELPQWERDQSHGGRSCVRSGMPAQELPQWERDLLERQAADEDAGIRVVEDRTEVFCRTCREWKAPEGSFFRNQKSRTGYESKCRACRRAARAA